MMMTMMMMMKMHGVVKSKRNVTLPPRCNTSFQETKTNALNHFDSQFAQNNV